MSKINIYTLEWNETTKTFDFYSKYKEVKFDNEDTGSVHCTDGKSYYLDKITKESISCVCFATYGNSYDSDVVFNKLYHFLCDSIKDKLDLYSYMMIGLEALNAGRNKNAM